MTTSRRSVCNGVEKKPAGAIIRAEEVPFWLTGADYLDAARQAFEKVRQDIPRILAEEKAVAYRDGREAATKDVLDWLAAMKAQAQSRSQILDRDIAELVIQIVEEVIGELSPSESVAMTVCKALKTIDLGDEFSLYVAPELFGDVRERLLSALDPTAEAKLELRQDPLLPKTGCRLVSEYGVVDLSIEKQLAILADSLRAAGVGLRS